MAMHRVVADIEITPVGTEKAEIVEFITASEKILKQFPDLKTEINPMSTSIEGDLDTILQAVREMHEATFREGAKRVITTIRVDDRHDGVHESLTERVNAVKERL